MIISDLSHFEEVVAARSIVGGLATEAYSTITADELVSESLLDLLSPGTRKLLKETKVKVNTVTVEDQGVSATAKTATTKTNSSYLDKALSLEPDFGKKS